MEFVKVFDKDRITHITINRPEKKNALNSQVVAELTEAFEHATNTPDTKVVTLKAKGDVFCAGADLKYLQELQGKTYEENLADSNHLMSMFKTIYDCPKPIVAQVQGHALAGGCGLISVCDFVFAVPEALFGYSEVKIGFVPAIVMPFLVKKIGLAPAKEMMLSGDPITAEEAMFFKLITHIADDEVLNAEVKEFAVGLANKNSGEAMTTTKQLFQQIEGLSIDDALKLSTEANAKARETEDFKKGIDSFLNKKKIEW